MTGSEIYGFTKAGLGVASDIYGAYSTGKAYEEEAERYRIDAINEVARNKQSFQIREDQKDRAHFGGLVASQEYLRAGADRINSIRERLTDMNNQNLLQQDIAYEQSLAVDETVGNMMSRNAIDAMKAEARLRAGAASTGTEGGSTQQATYEARSVQMFDNAVLIGRANSQKLNINRRLQMDRISNMNKKKFVASELSNVMGVYGAGAAYTSGYDKTYASIDKNLKEGYISYDKAVDTSKKTWLDDIFKYKDIIINSGLDDAATRFFNNRDFEACSGNITCQEETITALEIYENNKKNTMRASSPVTPIPGV